MIEWYMIEVFFEAWRNTALAFFSFAGFSFTIYRLSVSIAKKRTLEEQRQCNQDSSIKALQDRVDKLSSLCEAQIESNKEAYALAKFVKGKLER